MSLDLLVQNGRRSNIISSHSIKRHEQTLSQHECIESFSVAKTKGLMDSDIYVSDYDIVLAISIHFNFNNNNNNK